MKTIPETDNSACVRMNICKRCQALLGRQKTEKEDGRDISDYGVGECGVCLGAFADDFVANLQAAIEEAIRPYSTVKENRFCYKTCPPMLILPGDLVYRHHLAACSSPEVSKDLSSFGQRLKNHVKDKLIACLQTIEKGFDSTNGAYPPCVSEEEQGHLAVHVIVLPRAGVVRPTHQLPSTTAKRRNRKRKLAEDSQGGDPRVNLESKLRNEGKIIWTINQALDVKFSSDDSIDAEILDDEIVPPALDFHVAVWRRPFYLRGTYTKSRRDVSQTPFYVVDAGIRRKLGVTSVEEQILPVVSKYCGGISTLNNDLMLENVVFGMAKFHASGREDMDVRMLLPDPETCGDTNITGRPFVCEITDALNLLRPDQLDEIVSEINHFKASAGQLSSMSRSHGKNPLGVGIAPDLQFVPATAFKNLQAETEKKVKYYGCLCWSSEPLPGDEESLMEKLGTFPLQIQQRTPIRVLHRRSNVVRTRHVLSCSARIIDMHHFRLHISTDAGTYVKEFVHSDLGRTEPSVASLLGCRCDLLELDCEGIQAA